MTTRADELVERLRTGKIRLTGPISRTLNARPMTLTEWRQAGAQAADLLETLSPKEGMRETLEEARTALIYANDAPRRNAAIRNIDRALSSTGPIAGEDGSPPSDMRSEG